LCQPQIPQNTGNVGRTCLATGSKLWLVRPLGFLVDDRHLRRAGLDYWQYLQWEVLADNAHFRRQFHDRRCWFFSKTGTTEYTDVGFQRNDALVFGSETQGLPAAMLDGETQSVLRIPVRSEVRSLNLASAVAVAIYEARRQLCAGR
jgi:tRNA (cytidine/uridine-2'-O-)-methyltransferase